MSFLGKYIKTGKRKEGKMWKNKEKIQKLKGKLKLKR